MNEACEDADCNLLAPVSSTWRHEVTPRARSLSRLTSAWSAQAAALPSSTQPVSEVRADVPHLRHAQMVRCVSSRRILVVEIFGCGF